MSRQVDEILDALSRCKTVAEVNATAKHYAQAVAIIEADPKLKVRAIHIKNMAKYRRMCIQKGWG